jgi:hypothetical protein
MLLTRHLDANAALVSLIEPLATRDGFIPTPLPGVQVLRCSQDIARGPQLYEPSLVIIAQGSKLAYLGPRTMEYGAGHYLIQALPVPFECETYAMPDAPLLGISVAIDRAMLGELVLAMGLMPGRSLAAQTPESMTSAVLDGAMRARPTGMPGHGPGAAARITLRRLARTPGRCAAGTGGAARPVRSDCRCAEPSAYTLHRTVERRDIGQLREHERFDLP